MKNKIDISKLTEAEQQELLMILDERKAKKRRKKAYALVQKTPEQRPNYIKLWERVKSAANITGYVTPENIEAIWKDGQENLPVPKEEIYPCPECGEMSLQVGKFGNDEHSKRQIFCSHCYFVCPEEYGYGDQNPADPTASIEEIEDYGYYLGDILPLHAEAAERYFELNLPVYKLYDSGCEESPVTSCMDLNEHASWDGLFGIFIEDWEKYQESKCNNNDIWENFHNWLVKEGYLNPADPTVSIKEMEDYGYKGGGMLPISKTAAKKYYVQHNIQVYMLYPDGTEAAVEKLEQIKNADDDALFGLEVEDWRKYQKLHRKE